jgi:hypothetical protein
MLLNWYWEDHEVDDNDPGQATALEIINGLVAADLAA